MEDHHLTIILWALGAFGSGAGAMLALTGKQRAGLEKKINEKLDKEEFKTFVGEVRQDVRDLRAQMTEQHATLLDHIIALKK